MAQAKLNERLKTIILNYIRENSTSLKDLGNKFAKEDPVTLNEIIAHLETFNKIKVNPKTGAVSFNEPKSVNYEDLLDEFDLSEHIPTPKTRSRNGSPMHTMQPTQTQIPNDPKFEEMLRVCRELKIFKRVDLKKKLKWAKSVDGQEQIEKFIRLLLSKNILKDVDPYCKDISFQLMDTTDFLTEKINREIIPIESEELPIKENKIKQPEQISQSSINDVWVICSKCGIKQIYHPRTAKRQHKYCDSCKKHFDIKLEESKKVDATPDSMQEFVKLELQEIDKQILQCFFDSQKGTTVEKTQKDLVDLLKKDKSTISRHLDQLIKLNLIEKIKCDLLPNAKHYYRLVSKIPYVEAAPIPNPNDEKDPKKITTDQIIAATCHRAHVTMTILSGEFPEKIFTSFSKMKHWGPKYFDRKEVSFCVTTKSLTFSISGIGSNDIKCFENLQNKAIVIQRIFEAEYNLKLSSPNIKANNIEYVPILCSNDEFKELEMVWSDKSHKFGIETNSRRFLQELVKYMPEVDQLKDTLNNLEDKVKVELDTQRRDNQALCAKIDEMKIAINTLKTPPPEIQQNLIAHQNEVLKSVSLRMELLENQFELKKEEDKQFQNKFLPLFQMIEQLTNQKQNSNENQNPKSGTNPDMFL